MKSASWRLSSWKNDNPAKRKHIQDPELHDILV
jgi:hypothetical protein